MYELQSFQWRRSYRLGGFFWERRGVIKADGHSNLYYLKERNEWIVTTKLGDGSKTKPSMEVIVKNAKDLRDAKVIEPLLGDYKKPQVRTRQRY